MENVLIRIKRFNQQLEKRNYDYTLEEMSVLRNEWMSIVLQLIADENYDLAKTLFYKILINDRGEVNKGWLNMDAAVLDVMFLIYDHEKKNGDSYTFDKVRDIQDMKRLCLKLKVLLRRIEYDLPEEYQQEIIRFVRENKISASFIIVIVQRYIERQVKVLNKTAIMLCNNDCIKMALSLLLFSCDIKDDFQETIFCLAYTLFKLGEMQTAFDISKLLDDSLSCNKILKYRLSEKKSYTDSQDAFLLEEILLHNSELYKLNENFSLHVPEVKEKIAFICCVNKEDMFRECELYINNLLVPDGYEVEIIPIRGAVSMTSGNNEGMRQSDAKYKIYLHQDILCLNPYLLYNILKVFEMDSGIGMLGVAGTPEVPATGIWWDAECQYLNLYQDNMASFGCDEIVTDPKQYNHGEYQDVMMLDGVFLATRNDISWRQDIFEGWHFYDVSQCMEFKRAGMKVVLARCEYPWVMHYGDYVTVLDDTYEYYRKIFLNEYKNDIQNYYNMEE